MKGRQRERERKKEGRKRKKERKKEKIISGFRPGAVEVFALLDFDTAAVGSCVPTFRQDCLSYLQG